MKIRFLVDRRVVADGFTCVFYPKNSEADIADCAACHEVNRGFAVCVTEPKQREAV